MFGSINGKKLAAVALAGVIAFSGVTYAFAADQTSSSEAAGRNKPAKMDFSKMTDAIDSALDKLVTAGTITQAQADAVLKDFNTEDRGGERKDRLSDLVASGTITQTQSDAVTAAMKTAREAKTSVEDALKALVTKGTLTQAQLDSITSEMKPGDRMGSPQQGERKDPLADQVTAGTITQAQADAVSAAMKTAVEDALKALVSKGTLTQAQLDSITSTMKPGDRKDAPPQGERKDPLAELVTAGTMTQAQAGKVNAAIKAAMDSLKDQ